MSCNISSMMGFCGKLVVLLTVLATFGGCKSTTLTKGRCDKASDCSGGLTCDSLHTCVPTTLSTAPCANDAQCGSDYACDNLRWCVCRVPNSNLSPSDDPCSNGTLPPYRGTTNDGGMPDGGDAGPRCSVANCPSPKACTDAGVCVECATNVQCSTSTKPICDTTSVCRACASDSECPSEPSVCMADGHCATTTETVYVQNNPGTCVGTPRTGSGTLTMPFCSLAPALVSADVRDLIVVRGTVAGSSSIQGGTWLIVGQQSAKITPDTGMPGIQISGAATVYIRGVRISGGDNVGISAGAGSMISLTGVKVDTCVGGGILLDGAAFDIENTTVTGSGPGTFMALTTWGGILVNNPPAGLTKLNLLTVENNNPVGVSCSAGISGLDVLASGSTSGVDITNSCGFSSCGTAGPMCGAQ